MIGKDGISEIVSVTELIPGAFGGLKEGDKRPARDKPGDVATTWDPKPKSSGSSGAASAPKPPAGRIVEQRRPELERRFAERRTARRAPVAVRPVA